MFRKKGFYPVCYLVIRYIQSLSRRVPRLFEEYVRDCYFRTRPIDNLKPKVAKEFRPFYLLLVKKFRYYKVLKALIVR